MYLHELRKKFLEYFKAQNHAIVGSSSLIPQNDNTLLFTNAGMVQFKDVFLGNVKRDYKRAASSQKCIRAGGKHNDLENVGYTARHHTFFEMLGNFSFGDYFKKEAIEYAWQFITEELKIDPNKLWVTVHHDDDDAEKIWLNNIGVDKNRISRCGDKDNFWMMGDTGPCGPCSEIFFDHGENIPGGPPGSPDEDCDRYIEIWNLVFMQYNKFPDGRLEKLPSPSVDTGMGLERISAVMQGVHNNYDIDLFQNLLKFTKEIIPNADLDNKSLRVIADHLRSCSFLVSDGIVPSNEGRGYVLRRIMRRAIRHGYMLGMQDPFFYKLVSALVTEMGDFFTDLKKNCKKIQNTFESEEIKFAATLKNGMKIFDDFLNKNKGIKTIPGEILFTLYDTYGFPLDLTADLAKEKGLNVDLDGFEKSMKTQKQLGKKASKFNSQAINLALDLNTEFVGYTKLSITTKPYALFDLNGKKLQILEEEGLLILNETPFYAEAGGQVADSGKITTGNAEFLVCDVQKNGNTVIHYIKPLSGSISVDDDLKVTVEKNVRQATALNHSATHLLHAALRSLLGTHVIQKGSLVDEDKLRFDFSHPKSLTEEEILNIEDMVNEKIRENTPVLTEVLPIEEAKAKGAMSLFGEKYGDKVRVLSMGGAFSIEFCGGTHVKNTGDIGLFKITSESAIASGVRRIEAITGAKALNFFNSKQKILNDLMKMLSSSEYNIVDKSRQNIEKIKVLEAEISNFNKKLSQSGTEEILKDIKDISGIKLIVSELDISDTKELRSMIDMFKNKFEKAIIVLASVSNERVNILVGISKECVSLLKASELVNFIAKQVNGKGGGRDDFAQAGGTDIKNLKNALNSVENFVKDVLSK